jgi:hypothetical protein
MKSVSQPIGHLDIEGPMSLCAGTPGREECSKAVHSCVTPFDPARRSMGLLVIHWVYCSPSLIHLCLANQSVCV